MSPEKKKPHIWIVREGFCKMKGTITLESAYKNGEVIRHKGKNFIADTFNGKHKFFKGDACLKVGKGFIGGPKYITFKAANAPKYYMAHAKYKKGEENHNLLLRAYPKKGSKFRFRKAASILPQ